MESSHLHTFWTLTAASSCSIGLVQYKITEPEGWYPSSSYVECRAQWIRVLQPIILLHSTCGNWTRPHKFFLLRFDYFMTLRMKFCYPIGFAIVNCQWEVHKFLIVAFENLYTKFSTSLHDYCEILLYNFLLAIAIANLLPFFVLLNYREKNWSHSALALESLLFSGSLVCKAKEVFEVTRNCFN